MDEAGRGGAENRTLMPLRILLISMDDAFAVSLAELLAAEGHEVSCVAGSAPQKISAPAPDLIIGEVASEGGKVIESLARLQKGRDARHVPLIVISALPEYEFEFANVFDFMLKPLDMKRLRENLEMIAGKDGKSLRSSASEQLSEADYRLFYDFLLTRTGLRFERRNARFLTRGIMTRMQNLQIDSYNEYFKYLNGYQESRQELQKLLQLLTVGETYFFRYSAHFEALTDFVKKELPAEGKLRVWSAGCSTGEEPYSIAMSIMDGVIGWQGRDISIIATDLNKRSLLKAKKGIFRPWVMRAMDQQQVKRHFDRDGDCYRIKNDVKNLVRFCPLNLQVESFPGEDFSDLDAIFCRNVLIYFDIDSAHKIVNKMATCLKPGGFLFLGHAETLSFLSSQFERHTLGGGFYYRKKSGESKTAEQLQERRKAQERRMPVRRKTVPIVPAPVVPPVVHEPDTEMLYRQSLSYLDGEDFAAASVCLDELLRYEPQHPGALVAKGFLLANDGKFDEAIDMCAKSLTSDDLFPPAYFLKGLVLEMTDDPVEAVNEYRKALLLDMEFVMPHYCLGRLFQRLGREAEGIRELRNCMKILERGKESAVIPYSGGLVGEALLERLRRELSSAEDQAGLR